MGTVKGELHRLVFKGLSLVYDEIRSHATNSSLRCPCGARKSTALSPLRRLVPAFLIHYVAQRQPSEVPAHVVREQFHLAIDGLGRPP
jgi:hypothetical protein